MDPVTALGVAAAALQFLDLGLKALELCQEIRDDTEGASKAHKEIQSQTSTIGQLVKELRSATSGTGRAASRRINKIANDCISTSDDLLALLVEVRRTGNSTFFKVAQTTFRVMKEARRI